MRSKRYYSCYFNSNCINEGQVITRHFIKQLSCIIQEALLVTYIVCTLHKTTLHSSISSNTFLATLNFLSTDTLNNHCIPRDQIPLSYPMKIISRDIHILVQSSVHAKHRILRHDISHTRFVQYLVYR